MRQAKKIHFQCHFKTKIMFDAISSTQNWHAKLNFAKSDLDLYFLNVITSFTCGDALIVYLEVPEIGRKYVPNTEIYCLGLSWIKTNYLKQIDCGNARFIVV